MKQRRLPPQELEPGDLVQLPSDRSASIVLSRPQPDAKTPSRILLEVASTSGYTRTVFFRSSTKITVLDPDTSREDPFARATLQLRIARLQWLLDTVTQLPPYAD